VSSNIRETDNHLSIGKDCPVKVVAPGVIGGLVPPAISKPGIWGRSRGRSELLDGARYLQVVLGRLQLLLGFSLAKSRLDMLAICPATAPATSPPKRRVTA
jgi:hypothetical protein